MSKPWISVRGVDRWVDAVQSANKHLESDVKETLRDVGSYFRALLRGRTWPVKKVTVHDGKPGTRSGAKPVTLRIFGNQAEVEIREYWGNARNKQVKAAMQKAGLGHLLVRTALWVDRSQPRGPNKKKLEFRDAPRLMPWAEKFGQIDRHAVEIPARALYPLAIDPALDYGEEKILRKLEAVAQRFARAAQS